MSNLHGNINLFHKSWIKDKKYKASKICIQYSASLKSQKNGEKEYDD